MQVKNRPYRVAELIGDETDAKRYAGGQFAIVYLSPRDYHRVHSPIAGDISIIRSLPGDLFPVNSLGERHVPSLFSKNRRVAIAIDTPALGRVTVTMVGAIIVGRISVTAMPGPDVPLGEHRLAPPVHVEKGDEIGIFHLGSTAIVFVEPGKVPPFTRPTGPVRMGESMTRGDVSQPPPPRAPRWAPAAARPHRSSSNASSVVKEVRRSGPPRPSSRTRAARAAMASTPAPELMAEPPESEPSPDSVDAKWASDPSSPDLTAHSRLASSPESLELASPPRLASSPESLELASSEVSSAPLSEPAAPEAEVMLPIPAMPIISLGKSQHAELDAVEVGAGGLHRTSVPPPAVAENPRRSEPSFDEHAHELPPIRPPADSLVQEIPSEREADGRFEADSLLDIEIRTPRRRGRARTPTDRLRRISRISRAHLAWRNGERRKPAQPIAPSPDCPKLPISTSRL